MTRAAGEDSLAAQQHSPSVQLEGAHIRTDGMVANTSVINTSPGAGARGTVQGSLDH